MRCSCSIYLRAVSADGQWAPSLLLLVCFLMARPDGDCCSVDDHERCLQYGLSCLCCLCVSGLDYVSAELWLFCCSVSVVHFVSPVRLPCDASLVTVTHAAAGDKINSESNNGITVAGWIESAFDEPTSQERINRGSRRLCLLVLSCFRAACADRLACVLAGASPFSRQDFSPHLVTVP